MQGLEPAHREKRVERACDRADRVVQERHLLGEFMVVACDDDAADHVGMTVEVLGRRMQDEIRAVFERPLQHRRTKRIVDDEDQAMLAREGADFGEVDQGQHRIGRRLGPDHARVRLQRRLQRGLIVEVEESEIESRAASAHALEQAIGAAVEIVHRDHMAARIEQIEHRARRGEARAERIAARAAFEIGNAALVGHARRILRAAVFVAFVHAGAGLDIGRGRVDRRHDRAGRGVRGLTGMDGARAEAEGFA